jgi:two-component system response regulator FixJ
MNPIESIVYVIDDDTDVRESLDLVLRSVGYSVRTFSTADEFLATEIDETPHCLIVDLLLPGMTGLSLCRKITSRNSIFAFLVITGNGDVSSAVESMRLGAVDFLEKPFSRQKLLDAVDRGVQQARSAYEDRLEEEKYAGRLAQLTPRELEVLQDVAEGLLTKEISKRMGISSRTVDVHRSRIMQKLGIESPMQLAKIFALRDVWRTFS